MKILSVTAIAVVLVSALSTQPAAAGCKQGFCVSGSDSGKFHAVTFTSSYSNVHHYNVSSTRLNSVSFENQNQGEIGRNVRNFLLRQKPGETVAYSLQACSRNILGKSTCGPWVTFTHRRQK